MPIIKQLSEEVIAHIAAGEVIERPAFAVKELVENAIDAQAKNIDIFIKDGGLTEITVVDDGIGMSKADLVLSVLPHTTSKLNKSEDLLSIRTLGFRGEGLSSLASISELTIASRNKVSPLGHQIYNSKEISDIGMAIGTHVTALKLMDNVPGRKKFLKTERHEFKLIYDYICAFALVYTKVSFKLTHNNKEYVNFNGSDQDRIATVFGKTVSEKFMHANSVDSLISVDLFLSHPEDSLPSNNKLIQFVNNRRVQNNLITLAIKEAYGKLLDPHSFPQGIISISVPPQFIDVNVHPTKSDIRFESPDLVFNQIKEAATALLTKYNLTFGSDGSFNTTNREIVSTLRDEVRELAVSNITEDLKSDDILIIDNTFLCIPHKDGLLLFDQHAVHEALLFEAFVTAFEKHKSETTELEESLLITLTRSEMLAFEEHEEVLKNLGFEIENFGGNTIKVFTIPKLTNEHNIASHIKEILEYLETAKYPSVDRLNNKMLAFLACKSAIKAGDRLTKNEARKLISQLTEHNSIYTCPHGRPVKRVLSVRELKKMFKRI